MSDKDQGNTLPHGLDKLPIMMSITDLANLVGTSRNGIAGQVADGRLPAVNICVGGRPKYRIMRDDIVAWLLNNPVTPIHAPEVK